MNESMTDQEIREIEALAAKATPGPWAVDKMGRYEDHDECEIELPDDEIELCRYENADFIAASRLAVPRMAGEIRRLRAENEALRHIVAEMTFEEPKTYATNNVRVTVTHGHVGVTCEGGQWNG